MGYLRCKYFVFRTNCDELQEMYSKRHLNEALRPVQVPFASRFIDVCYTENELISNTS
jgi:hypothetical protein